MRIKTYKASSMAEAMDQVRAELGEDAIILSSEPGQRGRGVRVIAALDAPDPDEADFERWDENDPHPTADSDPLGAALSYHGVPAILAERLERRAAAVAGLDSVLALAAAFESTLAFRPLDGRLDGRPLMLVGPAGVGKTLTAAKLIVDARRRGNTVIAATCDTRRAGGIEQLEAFTRIIEVPLSAASTPDALRSLIAASSDAAVIIDTAGTNPFDAQEMRQLRRLIEAADAEPLMVLAAGVDAIEAGEVATAFSRIGCQRMLATRLDVTRRLGALLSAGDTGRLAIAGASISPHAAEAPSPVNPLSLARLLFSTAPEAIPALDRREASR
jgi:flagellar biosynthesis protein FlhF